MGPDQRPQRPQLGGEIPSRCLVHRECIDWIGSLDPPPDRREGAPTRRHLRRRRSHHAGVHGGHRFQPGNSCPIHRLHRLHRFPARQGKFVIRQVKGRPVRAFGTPSATDPTEIRLIREPENGSWFIHRFHRFHRWTGTRGHTASLFSRHPRGETTASLDRLPIRGICGSRKARILSHRWIQMESANFCIASSFFSMLSTSLNWVRARSRLWFGRWTRK